ncbi:MAG: hypothetical protein JWO28_2131, partial [Hyphomicrobiales bacterium]|nr:hypothetical protein [Hyphomicrobiales bacterium]
MTDPKSVDSFAYDPPLDSEDIGSNGSTNPTLGDVIAARLNRRDVLRGALAVSAIGAAMPGSLPGLSSPAAAQTAAPKSSFNFTEISAGSDETHHAPEGYEADILMRWGDPVLPGAPAFDPQKQTA